MEDTAKIFYTMKRMVGQMDGYTLIAAISVMIAFVVAVYVMLAYLKKTRVKKMREDRDPKEDAFNQIQMLRSMVRLMQDKGYNVSPVENMIVKAQMAYNIENYAECIEIVNSAKRVLARIREETSVPDRISPRVAEEMRIIKKIEESTPPQQEMPPQVKDFERKLPQNYLQSKFEIKVVEDKIMKKEDEAVKDAAMLYLNKAKEAFESGEYREALRLAIKSNRILDTNEIPVETPIMENKPNVIEAPKIEPKVISITETKEEEEKKEEEELHCPNCGAVVRREDKYCWNCGAKLVWTYKCPNCGAEVTTEDNYCRHCGYKLK